MRATQGDSLKALHEHGWHSLSGEQQDELIASGWHPGPNGGCGRRIGRLQQSYCGVKGLCPRCWSETKGGDARIALETALCKIESGRITGHDKQWARLIRETLAL